MTWEFPKLTLEGFFIILLFLAVIALIYILVSKLYIKNENIKTLWYKFSAFAVRKGLSQKEVLILKTIFDDLSVYHLETINNPKQFHKLKSLFFRRLNEQKAYSVENLVNLLDKLFSENTNNTIEISQLDQLITGESCGIEILESHYLGTIIHVEGNEVLISIPEQLSHPPKVGSMMNLYVYRIGIGGFSLHGKLSRVFKNTFTFYFENKIESKGNEHLMANIKLNVNFAIWKKHDSEEKQEHKITYANESFTAFTDKISDRAILVTIGDEINEYSINWKEIWEVTMYLDSGYEFKCRGKFVRSELSSNKYIFKFIDSTEEDRKSLFQEIRKSQPTRENMR